MLLPPGEVTGGLRGRLVGAGGVVVVMHGTGPPACVRSRERERERKSECECE